MKTRIILFFVLILNLEIYAKEIDRNFLMSLGYSHISNYSDNLNALTLNGFNASAMYLFSFIPESTIHPVLASGINYLYAVGKTKETERKDLRFTIAYYPIPLAVGLKLNILEKLDFNILFNTGIAFLVESEHVIESNGFEEEVKIKHAAFYGFSNNIDDYYNIGLNYSLGYKTFQITRNTDNNMREYSTLENSISFVFGVKI